MSQNQKASMGFPQHQCRHDWTDALYTEILTSPLQVTTEVRVLLSWLVRNFFVNGDVVKDDINTLSMSNGSMIDRFAPFLNVVFVVVVPASESMSLLMLSLC